MGKKDDDEVKGFLGHMLKCSSIIDCDATFVGQKVSLKLFL